MSKQLLMKNMGIKEFLIEFDGKSYERIKEISQQLNLSESDVIRNGLKFIALYAKTQTEKDTRLIIEKDGDQRQITI